MELNLIIGEGPISSGISKEETKVDTDSHCDGPSSPSQSNPNEQIGTSNNSSILAEIDMITENDIKSENARILEARKDSQLTQKLEALRKQQIVLQMYNDQIKSASVIKNYRRKTNLDKPEEFCALDVVLVNDTDDQIKLNKEEQIDDFEIKMQFMPCTDNECQPQMLEMNIEADIQRLCQMYLNNLGSLKGCLPSDNVENRHYEKLVQLYSVNSKSHLGMIEYTGKQNNKSLISNSRDSISRQSQSMDFSRSTSNNPSMMMDQKRTESMNTLQTQQSNRSNLEGYNGAQKLDLQLVQVQCEPQLIRADQIKDNQQNTAQLWQELLAELQSNPIVMADVVQRMMTDGFDQFGFDYAHSTAFVNMGQFFWDAMHTEERLAFHQNNNFLKFFATFAKQAINQDNFYRDDMNNVQFKDQDLKAMIMCLFEGLTRKIPAFNYLRFVYQGPFNRINLFSIVQDLHKNAGGFLNQSTKSTVSSLSKSSSSVDLKSKQKEEQKVEKGFWKELWNKITSKDKEQKKSDTKNKPLADDDMIFDNKESLIANKNREQESHNSNRDSLNNSQIFLPNIDDTHLYDSLASIYGGPPDPFSDFIVIEGDTKSKFDRFESIDDTIVRGYQNNHQFVMDAYPEFKSSPQHKIVIDEKEIRSNYMERQSVRSSITPSELQGMNERPTKNLTYYLKSLVQKNFEQMLNFSNKIPFSIRAMLKILIIRSRGQDNFTQKIKPAHEEIHLLAQILIAGWLNVGYRNPKCFGIQPSEERELELEFIFFQASRIVFEHMMLMQRMPDDHVEGFEIDELNKFIVQMSSQVFIFWTRLLSVDISEVMDPLKPQIIESCMLRIDDLQLLYIYCQKVFLDVQNGLLHKGMDEDKKAKWAKFNEAYLKLDKNLKESLEYQEDDQEWLIPANSTGLTLSNHFQDLLSIDTIQDATPYEYFMLFFNKKSERQIEIDLESWYHSCQNEIKQFNQQFVSDKLASGAPLLKHHSPLPDIIQGRSRQSSTIVKREVLLQATRISNRQSQQFKLNHKLNHLSGTSELQDTRQVRLHRLQPTNLPINQVEVLLFNIFNSLRVLLDNPLFRLECLRDHTNSEEIKDLSALLISAEKANRDLPIPCTQIQVGCMHIVRMLKKLNLEGHFEIQNKIMNHFLRLIEHKIKTSRRYLDQIIVSMDILSVDVQRFESNITNMKQFHTRYENNRQFMEKISRYNPEVCLLECFKFDLSEEWKPYKGLLLNLSCANHKPDIPMCTHMIFGGINRQISGQPVPQPQLTSAPQIVSEIDLQIRKTRDKRNQRFKEHYYIHTTFTVSLQNSHDLNKPYDKEIRLISEFINYFTRQGKPHLRTLIRCDNEKYRSLLSLNIVQLPSHLVSDGEKYDFLRQNEPLDYMNMVKTYTMFLQHLSVLSSTTIQDTHVNERDDKDFQIKQHYDFLNCDLAAKALRYQIHDYVMKRIYRTMFGAQKHTDVDALVQKLILAKQNDPEWVLKSQRSFDDLAAGKEVKDFTKTPEWCDPFIYTASLKTLLKVSDEATPHMKAIYIDDAVTQAMNAMKISTPYKKSDAFGEPERQRVMRHLILEMCKIYDKAKTNPRLYSQLLYILLFNVPQNEIMVYSLIKQQNQRHQQDPLNQERDFSKLPIHKQHQFMLGQINNRNKVYEWFSIVQNLIYEDQQKQLLKAATQRKK